MKEEDTLWPEERSWHAACCLSYGQQHPQLLVTGGKNRQGEVLGDAWILDVDSRKWKKVKLNYMHISNLNAWEWICFVEYTCTFVFLLVSDTLGECY